MPSIGAFHTSEGLRSLAQVKTVGKIATGHACGTTDGDVASAGLSSTREAQL